MTNFTLSFIFLAGLAAAQSSPPPAARTARNAEVTIRGCIDGGQRFTFMQAGTGAMFSLIGQTGRFVPLEGKLVEITGSELPPPAGSSEFPQLQVTQTKIVDNKCPIQAEPRPATANQSTPNRRQPGNAATSQTSPYTDPGTVNQRPQNVSNPNEQGATGAPSPGTGNPPPPPQ